MPLAIAEFEKWVQIGQTFIKKHRIYYVSALASQGESGSDKETASFKIRYDYGQDMELAVSVANKTDLVELTEARVKLLSILLKNDTKSTKVTNLVRSEKAVRVKKA